MAVSLKTDLRFPESGQHGHGSRIIHQDGWGQALQEDYDKVCTKTRADHFVRKLSVPVLILSESL